MNLTGSHSVQSRSQLFLEPLSSLFLHSSIHSLRALANHSVGCWSCFDGKHEPGTVCTFILLTVCRDCVTLDRTPTSMSQCPPWGGMLISPKSPSSTPAYNPCEHSSTKNFFIFFKRGGCGGAKRENFKALQPLHFVAICSLELWREGAMI